VLRLARSDMAIAARTGGRVSGEQPYGKGDAKTSDMVSSSGSTWC
jgi:hypothetical protein